MIDEQHLEVILRAIRSVSYEDAREHLRTLCADARADGMLDFANALQNPTAKEPNLRELKAKFEGSTVEKFFKDGAD